MDTSTDAKLSSSSEQSSERPAAEGLSLPAVDKLSASKLTLAAVRGIILDSVSWFLGGRVRISVSAGVFAAFIVALGFALFDLQHQERMLREKYPHAVSAEERHMLHARDLVLHREYATAEPILRRLVKEPQGTQVHATALFLLGDCLEGMAQTPAAAAEAKEVSEQFIAQYPADQRVPSVHLRVAEHLSRNALYSDSNAEYEKLLRMLPDGEKKEEIEFRIAQNYCRERGLSRAIALLEHLKQESSNTRIVRDSTLLLGRTLTEAGKHNDAERVLLDLVRQARGTHHAAAALHMLAANALSAGSSNEAVKYCTQWLEESPSASRHVDVLLTLGRAQLALGSPADAETVASEILALSPDPPKLGQALVLKGRSLEALGKMEEAENAYLSAVQNAPRDSRAHERVAELYASKADLPAAISWMEKAREADPRDDSLSLKLAKLYHLNAEDVNAIRVLEEVTRNRQLSVHIGEAFLLLADVQCAHGRPQDAYRTIERLLATGTTTVGQSAIHEKQGDILAQLGLYDDAIEAYNLAAEQDGGTASARIKLASTLLSMGKPQHCLDALRTSKVAALSPDESFDIAVVRARAFLDLKMYKEASRTIEGAVAFPTAREKISALALLLHTHLALREEGAASRVFEAALKPIETRQAEIPREARRIFLDWARYLYESGKYAEAAKVYSHVKEPAFPPADVAWAGYQEGNCYYHLTDYSKAREAYSRVVSAFPASEWVAYARQKQDLMEAIAGT